MDSTPASAVATRLGVPVARVLAACRRGTVDAAKDARGRWQLDEEAVASLVRRWGAVPRRCDGLDREAVLVLAAVVAHPRGLPSARAAGVAAGLSPTTASDRLRVLERRGLVQQVAQRRLLRGRAVAAVAWVPSWGAPGWEERLRVLNEVVLADSAPAGPASGRLPDHVWHLVWNADPASLEVRRDAAYLAGRVLDAADPEADAWAAHALPPAAWERAATRRGRSAREVATARRMAELARA